ALRKVRSGKMAKLKGVPVVCKVIGGGVVKLERVSVVCPACGQQVEAIATGGRVKGYCAVAGQSVDFLVETQQVPIGKHFTAEARDKISASAKKHWQDPEFRAEQIAAQKKRWQDPEFRAKQSAARIRRHNKIG
ncbi:unnamed protein product, partial [marine sediment metagenome]